MNGLQFRARSVDSAHAQIKDDPATWVPTAGHRDLTTIDVDRHPVAKAVPSDAQAHGIETSTAADSQRSMPLTVPRLHFKLDTVRSVQNAQSILIVQRKFKVIRFDGLYFFFC